MYGGEESYVKCSNCDEIIPESSTSCPQCGAIFEDEDISCTNCGHSYPASFTQCPSCGTAPGATATASYGGMDYGGTSYGGEARGDTAVASSGYDPSPSAIATQTQTPAGGSAVASGATSGSRGGKALFWIGLLIAVAIVFNATAAIDLSQYVRPDWHDYAQTPFPYTDSKLYDSEDDFASQGDVLALILCSLFVVVGFYLDHKKREGAATDSQSLSIPVSSSSATATPSYTDYSADSGSYGAYHAGGAEAGAESDMEARLRRLREERIARLSGGGF